MEKVKYLLLIISVIDLSFTKVLIPNLTNFVLNSEIIFASKSE